MLGRKEKSKTMRNSRSIHLFSIEEGHVVVHISEGEWRSLNGEDLYCFPLMLYRQYIKIFFYKSLSPLPLFPSLLLPPLPTLFPLHFFFSAFQGRGSLCTPSCPETYSVGQARLDLRDSPASASWTGIEVVHHHCPAHFHCFYLM